MLLYIPYLARKYSEKPQREKMGKEKGQSRKILRKTIKVGKGKGKRLVE